MLYLCNDEGAAYGSVSQHTLYELLKIAIYHDTYQTFLLGPLPDVPIDGTGRSPKL